MKKTELSAAQAGPGQEELPVRVQEALEDLVTAAGEGLLALSVGVGLGVLAELMEEEVVEVVGAKGKHDRDRVAVRHGHESGEVTLGGRRVGVARPRVRSADGASELPLGLDCRWDARSRTAVPARDRLPRPRQARRRDRTCRHRSSTTRSCSHTDRVGHCRRQPTITRKRGHPQRRGRPAAALASPNRHAAR